MAWLRIIWNQTNSAKVRANGFEPEDVNWVIDNPYAEANSRSSGRQIYFGWVPDGRFIAVPFDVLDEDMIYPVTAYEAKEPA